MWKDRVRPFVHPLPQWRTVGLAPPQQLVSAVLRWGDQSADVTADHTVASLKPLTIASSVDAGSCPALEYVDRKTGKLLGVLRLEKVGAHTLEGASVSLYRVVAGEHRCLAWPLRPWNAWLQNRLMLKNRSPYNFTMEPTAVQQLMIAYLCLRPVMLVSVAAPGHLNIFPMDLIGPLERSGSFALALRSTSISVPVMRDVRRVVLSSVPSSMKEAVYKLGGYHKQALMDWASLPFEIRASREFGIPAVASALRIQELEIVHSQEIGSHTFFLCRIVTDEELAQGRQLHHTAGFHEAYRRRRGELLAEV